MQYALITPARNEASFITHTLESVVAQTILPFRWIIVDDASSDETAAIIESYLSHYPFIYLLKLSHTRSRDFANKALAFSAGLKYLDCDYAFIGNLDADISLPPSYYEIVLDAFRRNPQLGIAGGQVHTLLKGQLISCDTALDSVGGAVQLFRRECFEEIEGYRPLPNGGIDAAAEISARCKGWKVEKVPIPVYEHRLTGSTRGNMLMARYRDGRKFYALGYDSFFFAARCVSRFREKPICAGSIAALCGFWLARMRGQPISLPQATVNFLRLEQRRKLRRLLSNSSSPRF